MAKMNKLDIMNLMGKAAHNKVRAAIKPDDEEDSLNSKDPKAKMSPADPKDPSQDYSEEAEKAIRSKMKAMSGEARPYKQKVAIAMSDARAKGLKVPSKKNAY